MLRLGRLGPDAIALARAVAVLGERATLARAEALAQIDPQLARELAATMARAEIFTSAEPIGLRPSPHP
jgi:hypothetical protein